MPELPFEAHLDQEYLVETLVDLLQADTAVPLGPETLMEPDHPKLVTFVQEVIRPKLREIGAHDIIDLPKNQLAVRMGSGESDKAVIIMAYTAAQHHNWMEEPFSGKIAIPDREDIDEPCAYGQGAEQNKAHLAAMLTLIKAFQDAETEFDGTLYCVVNNEARSTHECTHALLPKLDPKPDYGLLLIGGGNTIKVANRGRVDVLIDVEGEIAHSSTTDWPANAIMGANKVINRLEEMEFEKTHSDLGGQHAVPYQLVFDPVAPHTFPGSAHFKVDRRLLPGDDVDEAVAEIRAAVGEVEPFDITVTRDVMMEPSVVSEDSPIVRSLQSSIGTLDGEEAETVHFPGAFDAGGLTNQGIPTVMWGRPECNEDIMWEDYVTLRGVEEESRIVGRTVLELLE